MSVWAQIRAAIESEGSACLVSIVEVAGSSPREVGARMVVTRNGFHGSIGGGTLEWQALARAQQKLAGDPGTSFSTYNLGPDLGQCCGGRVKVATEVFAHADLGAVKQFAAQEAEGPFVTTGRIVSPEFAEHFGDERRKLFLFGAGHVGRALVLTLAPHAFDVVWVDPRPQAFPAAVPGNVTLVGGEPLKALAAAPAQAFVLVMTHSHALDFELVDAALRRADLPYIGLIGSDTKKARFLSRLKTAGVDNLESFVCPIGVPEIKSKVPAAIALGVAAQIVARDELLRSAALPLPATSASVKLGIR